MVQLPPYLPTSFGVRRRVAAFPLPQRRFVILLPARRIAPQPKRGPVRARQKNLMQGWISDIKQVPSVVDTKMKLFPISISQVQMVDRHSKIFDTMQECRMRSVAIGIINIIRTRIVMNFRIYYSSSKCVRIDSLRRI